MNRRKFLFFIPWLAACIDSREESAKIKDLVAKFNKEADQNLIDETDPTAIKNAYQANGLSSVIKLRKKIKQKMPTDQQICKNCRFYTAIGDNYGKCKLLTAGNVPSIGWCKFFRI